MASVDWPATLPQYPLQDGFQEEFVEAQIRTGMEVGPVKSRAKYTAHQVNYTLRYAVNAIQKGILDSFYITSLYYGNDPYNFVHPMTGEEIDAYMIAPASYVPNGNEFIATVNIRTLQA